MTYKKGAVNLKKKTFDVRTNTIDVVVHGARGSVGAVMSNSQRGVRGRGDVSLVRRSGASLVVMSLVTGGALFSLGTSASASSKASPSSMVPAKIRATGNLSDMVNSPYTPMEYQAAAGGAIVGFDIDVATALAKELKLKLVVTNTPNFAELIPAVESSRTDIVDSSVIDLTSRHGSIHFVDDFVTGTQFLGLNSSSSTLKSNSSLCGKTVALQSGTSYAAQIATLSKSICPSKKPISTISVTSPPEQQTQVQIGRAVALAQGPEINGALELSQKGKWHVIGKTFNVLDYGIMFNKNDTQLGKAIQAGLNVLIKNGTYNKILVKWHLSGDGVKAATIDKGGNG